MSERNSGGGSFGDTADYGRDRGVATAVVIPRTDWLNMHDGTARLPGEAGGPQERVVRVEAQSKPPARPLVQEIMEREMLSTVETDAFLLQLIPGLTEISAGSKNMVDTMIQNNALKAQSERPSAWVQDVTLRNLGIFFKEFFAQPNQESASRVVRALTELRADGNNLQTDGQMNESRIQTMAEQFLRIYTSKLS